MSTSKKHAHKKLFSSDQVSVKLKMKIALTFIEKISRLEKKGKCKNATNMQRYREQLKFTTKVTVKKQL